MMCVIPLLSSPCQECSHSSKLLPKLHVAYIWLSTSNVLSDLLEVSLSIDLQGLPCCWVDFSLGDMLLLRPSACCNPRFDHGDHQERQNSSVAAKSHKEFCPFSTQESMISTQVLGTYLFPYPSHSAKVLLSL